MLFVAADTPEALARNLAGLCGPAVLNLPEQHVPEEEPRRLAVLDWLSGHPGWLLIVDNVDTPVAARTAEDLLATVRGGHVLLTGRLSSWSGRVEPLELDVLAVDDAVAFLLERTTARRRQAADDAAQGRTLAVELGQLALALEQAGAYIGVHRLTLAGYLEHWRARHDRVLEWFDERLMQYPRSLAVTWQTSVDRLSEPARRLLRRLAWFAPDPIPESLLDVGVQPSGCSSRRPDIVAASGVVFVHTGNHFDTQLGENDFRPLPAADPRDALAELETYSLVTRSSQSPTFMVHRLVQDVTRRSLRDDVEHRTLTEALQWVADAFVGDPQDVRSWPALDPLAPHARAAAWHADKAGIADPTTWLMNQVGTLFLTKALHADAEPLLRRVLVIDEQRFGTVHANVAIHLNNLATLLQATNRLAEAEPLIRRALAIDEQSFGTVHPSVACDMNNLGWLLKETNRLAEAEPLMRRALAIDEQNFGTAHPDVARDLNNLALLLQANNRQAEAEPLMRRPVLIFLEFTRRTGHEHPHLQAAFGNYASLLEAMGRTEAEIDAVVDGLQHRED